MLRVLSLLVATALLAHGSLPAQSAKPVAPGARAQESRPGDDKKTPSGKPAIARPPIAIEKLTPEQLAERLEVRARKHVRLHVACQPKRVAPGASGTMIVTMLFLDDAVLLSPPPVVFDAKSPQGGLMIGTPSFRPAKPSTLAPALKGMPAYDNYAIFDLPFTVAPGTPPGQHHLLMLLHFDLHAGKTAGLIDHFTIRVEHDVVVGESASDAKAPVSGPVSGLVSGLAGKGPLAVTTAPPVAEPFAANDSPGGATPREPIAGAEPIAAAASAPLSTARAEATAREPESDQSPNIVIASGAVVLVLSALLFWRRRK